MNIQVTYTEKELENVLKCKSRRIRDLRKMGILKGTKVGKSYVYHNDEIQDLFKRYKGKDLPTKKTTI